VGEVRDFGPNFKDRNHLEDLNVDYSQTVDLWQTGPEGLVLYSFFGGSWQWDLRSTAVKVLKTSRTCVFSQSTIILSRRLCDL